ncbi:endonuclease/exonuclease/phosphatase family protein [Paracoccus kondratievae]
MTGPHAPERNLRVIEELQADVIALQEVDFRFGARPEALPRALIEKTTGMVPAPFIGTGENSLGWHGQTILLRPELRDKAEIRRLPLPGIEPRGALVLRLPGLTVVAVHLGLIRSSRRAQLSRIIAQARRIGHDRMVLTGDFNEWHDRAGLRRLRRCASSPRVPAGLHPFRVCAMIVLPSRAVSRCLTAAFLTMRPRGRPRTTCRSGPIWPSMSTKRCRAAIIRPGSPLAFRARMVSQAQNDAFPPDPCGLNNAQTRQEEGRRHDGHHRHFRARDSGQPG